jgi:hypothetical protein
VQRIIERKEKTMNIQSVGNVPENVKFEKPAGVPAQKEQDATVTDKVEVSNTPPEPGTKKTWTFLLYGAGDNNLSSFIENNVDDMEKVGSDANTHLISQLDLDEGNCKRYYVTKDQEKGLNSPVLEDMGPSVNMADPKTLTDFIVWGVKNYPGDYVALSIGDHGGGTAGAVADDRDGGWGMMKPQDIKKAIADAEEITGKKLDIVGFDCCLMANTEVAYELKDVANFLVASEETEGGYGWPYHKVLHEDAIAKLQEALRNKINLPPDQFVKKIIGDFATVPQDLPTMSSVDLGKMGDVAQKMDAFAKAIIDTQVPMSDLKSIAYQTESFSEFKDIYDFVQRVASSENIPDENLKTAAKDVMSSLGQAIVGEQHSDQHPDAHGLQIELPTWGGLSGGYGDLAFAKDTSWPKAMEKLGGNQGNQ